MSSVYPLDLEKVFRLQRNCREVLWKMKMNEKIEQELENQFPKGDEARGKALVLHAIAQIEYNKLQEAYDIAMKEIARLRK